MIAILGPGRHRLLTLAVGSLAYIGANRIQRFIGYDFFPSRRVLRFNALALRMHGLRAPGASMRPSERLALQLTAALIVWGLAPCGLANPGSATAADSHG